MFSAALAWSLSHSYVLLVPLVLYALRQRYGTGLSKYPGPFLASFTNAYRLWDAIAGRHRLPLVALHEKYGKIVRYGPNTLVISDPRAIKDIYTGSDAFPKAKHDKLRRGFGPAFTMTAVADLENYVDETIDFFIEKSAVMSADRNHNGGLVDLSNWFQIFAFDVLGQLLYGERHGFIEKVGDVDKIIGSVDFVNQYVYVAGQTTFIDRILLKNPLLVLAQEKKWIELTAGVIPFAMNHIQERSQREHKLAANGEPIGDLLDRMLVLQAKDPECLNDFEVVKMCAQFVFAGSDTTFVKPSIRVENAANPSSAITLSALFYYLLKNPVIFAKLQEEIDQACPTKSYRIRFAVASKLTYLDACMKETFRIHPASGFSQERVVPAGGRTILGEFIPGGTLVSLNGWPVHRDKEIFGDDVDVFRPERWLEDEGKAHEMAKYLFHFGAGNNACIGRNITLLEMYKLIPVWLRNFKMELEYPEKEWELTNNTFVKPKYDVKFTVRD